MTVLGAFGDALPSPLLLIHLQSGQRSAYWPIPLFRVRMGSQSLIACITSEEAATEAEDWSSRKQMSFLTEKKRAEYKDGKLGFK